MTSKADNKKAMAIRTLFCAVSCVLCLTAFPQTDCEQKFNGKYIASYWDCGLNIVKQPLGYSLGDWVAAAGVTGVGVASFLVDKDIASFFAKTPNSPLTTFADYSAVIGDEVFLFPASVACIVISHLGDNCRFRQASLGSLQSLVFAEGCCLVLKELTCRERPNGFGDNNNVWGGPFSTFSSTAFPSGHAIRSFALAAFLSDYYSDKPWVGITAYSAAAIVSAGRIVSSEHWTSDVVVGAALGIFIGKGTAAFNKKFNGRISMSGSTTGYGAGLTIKL